MHENWPLLYVLRSDMIWTAWAEFAFEPVPLQSEMQKPKTTLFGCWSNKLFAKDENRAPALIAPAPVPPTPSVTGLVTPL